MSDLIQTFYTKTFKAFYPKLMGDIQKKRFWKRFKIVRGKAGWPIWMDVDTHKESRKKRLMMNFDSDLRLWPKPKSSNYSATIKLAGTKSS